MTIERPKKQNMITTQNLRILGFKEVPDIFTKKQVWVLGEKDTEICGNSCRIPILYYNIDTQICTFHNGEFCVVQRECKSEEEIIKFVESINFLFLMSVGINYMSVNLKKMIIDALCDVKEYSYDEAIIFFDRLLLDKALKQTKYVIGVDTYDKYASAYCLGRKIDGVFEIILCKTMYDKNEFKQEVENLSKYFNVDVIS